MAFLSAEELNEQAGLSYLRGTYYVALLYTEDGYGSTITYTDVLSDEVTAGTGGYARLSYTYSSSDLLPYSTGQPLKIKVANFVHDGSSEDIVFTHVALLREDAGSYVVVGVESVGDVAVLSNGNTATVSISILHGRV